MKIFIHSVLYAFLFLGCHLLVQAQQPTGGGPYATSHGECVSEALRLKVDKDNEANRKLLTANGKLKAPKKMRSVSLQWPLRQAIGFDYCSYYGISNFVDHNSAFPNQVQDYNCGTRTYDLNSGYNHGGVDIFLWPFSWNMKNAGQVEIIAAAPGVILNKYDGQPDSNCAMGNSDWNAVFVQHADGSVAWYGHMKAGSLTTKMIGSSVAVGELLGLVGSSGSSTGPHLHFEIHDAANNVVDPYTGSCNPGASWWATARTYYEPTVNAALTHSAPPVFNACPTPDITNVKDIFEANDTIVFAGYFHDQLQGQQATFTVYKPDNSVFTTWTNTPTLYYTASYWYWTNIIPSNPMYGTWKFSISLQGQTCTHSFEVKSKTPAATSDLDNVANGLQLYPNPASHKVKLTNASDLIECYTIYGQKLNLKVENQEIDISELPNGLYLVKSNNQIRKLLVQHP